MNDKLNKSYDGLAEVDAKDIPELVDECLETKTNLLIYSEPGCGKSSIIEGLADYYVITLSAATLCEEALFGIPVYDQQTKTTPYAMPDWLEKVKNYCDANPGKKVAVFIDELLLAVPVIMNGLQILLTDRKLTTQPDYKLSDNVVIVAATNTASDSTEGYELSRPLKTRFMSVRMKATPDSFEDYAMTQIDAVMPHIKAVLGDEMAEQFVRDAVTDFKEFWCDDTKFYGTNPRTIMNYFKACDSVANRQKKLTPSDTKVRAERTVGHATHTYNWAAGQTTTRTRVKKDSLIPPLSVIETMSESELTALRETIMNSTKATTTAGIRALMAINNAIAKKGDC